MAAILTIDARIAERIDRDSVFDRPVGFTVAWPRDDWDGRAPHAAFLIEDDSLVGVGRAQGGRAITTVDRIIAVTDVEVFEPISLSTLKEMLPPRHKHVVDRVGVLPAGGGKALIEVVSSIDTGLAEILALAEESTSLRLRSGPAGAVLSQERDGLSLALKLGGIDGRVIRSWTPPAAGAPFLAGMPSGPAFEDHMINHDTGRFDDWEEILSRDVAWRIFEDGDRRMLVMNANRTAVEHTLGVDVVYWNERDNAFVLVQYKKFSRLQRGSRTIDAYRPDAHLDSELERMSRIDALCADQDGDFRLLATPCWVKLCRFDTNLKDAASLVSGMYLARAHFETLISSARGPRGGRILTHDNVDRHITNTLFVDLVKGGWIGSRASGSEQVKELVRRSLETGHSVVMGVDLSSSSA